MTSSVPEHDVIAVTTRGDCAENMHYGSAALVGSDGQLVASVGDPLAATFARSTIKPFQALPFVRADGLDKFAWGQHETAMLCASHSAEAFHLTAVRHMLSSAGHQVSDLGCGAHVPMDATTRCVASAPGEAWTALHNNCSGKHAGFLACCALHGWSRSGYLQPDHPLQKAIRQALSDYAQADVEAMPRGVDGCSAPIYALPLERLAFAFARLAQGPEKAAVALRDAMLREPKYISGSKRFDYLLAIHGQGDWVVKGGADGLQLVASVSRGLALAVKVADTNLRALNAVTLSLLRQIGWIDRPLDEGLASHDAPEITNWNGFVIGKVVVTARFGKD